ncbi:MAG: phosphoglucosamine mutase [Planctomycetota bacterium]
MHQRRYFGTDGIRDLANAGNLTPDKVLQIGHAMGRLVREKCPGPSKPIVGMVRDTRLSGPMIGRILSGALMAHGVDVYDAGMLPTPAVAYLVRREQWELGIVISASHNPMPDNGIKLFGTNGRKLSDDLELEIERYIDQAASRDVSVTGADVGRLTPFREGEQLYMDAMCQEYFGDLDLNGMKIVIDCANGSGSRVAPRILAALGAEVTQVNDKPDGLNINDNAGVFAIGALAPIIAAEGADLGLALDGDGDRVIMMDEKGRTLDGDDILAMLARGFSADTPKEERQIVATVMSNMGLKIMAAEHGIALHETAVGDRYVAEKMLQTKAKIGGEQSGHIIFEEDGVWFGDGLYSALRVVRAMKKEGIPLSKLGDAMEHFPQVLINVEVSEKPPISEILPLQNALRKYQLQLGDAGRILVRYSGTEKLARVMVEGREQAEIHAIAEDLVAVLKTEIG